MLYVNNILFVANCISCKSCVGCFTDAHVGQLDHAASWGQVKTLNCLCIQFGYLLVLISK